MTTREIKFQLIDITNWIKYGPLTVEEISFGQWEIEWRYYKDWKYDKKWDLATLPKKDYCYMEEEWTEFIWRQYTWLKDKNWKEIYEGDILWIAWKWNIEVFYNEDCACYEFWKDSDEYQSLLEDWDSCEIIWNIYENPELISARTI